MQIVLGADHRGFELKQDIKKYLLSHNHVVHDVGEMIPHENDDYPDFAQKAAQKVIQSEDHKGIIVCGSGVGISIAANKIPGIRCGLGIIAEQVAVSRKDDDINMLALASDFTTSKEAISMVEAFISSDFEASPSHVRRIEKITTLEQ